MPQIHALARAIFLQATPHKEIETFGDTDRSNIQDVMTRASFLFNEPTWKSIAFHTFDMESLYTLGAKNAKIYLEMQSTESNELEKIAVCIHQGVLGKKMLTLPCLLTDH